MTSVESLETFACHNKIVCSQLSFVLQTLLVLPETLWQYSKRRVPCRDILLNRQSVHRIRHLEF